MHGRACALRYLFAGAVTRCKHSGPQWYGFELVPAGIRCWSLTFGRTKQRQHWHHWQGSTAPFREGDWRRVERQ
eukprot:2539962-Pyramimonas_sp.AAC.1